MQQNGSKPLVNVNWHNHIDISVYRLKTWLIASTAEATTFMGYSIARVSEVEDIKTLLFSRQIFLKKFQIMWDTELYDIGDSAESFFVGLVFFCVIMIYV